MKNKEKSKGVLWVELVLAVMVLMPANIKAQYSHLYYHRTGDTIPYNTPIYYHNWWGFETSYHSSHGLTANVHGQELFGRKELSYYFTPTTLKVIGMAAFYPGYYWDEQGIYHSPREQEYLLLYEASTDSLYEVANIPLHLTDDTSRYIRLRGRKPGNAGTSMWSSSDSVVCCDGVRWDEIIPVTEYYFDIPVYVEDSFYVGLTDYSRRDPIGEHSDGPDNVLSYWFASNMYRTDCEGRVADDPTNNQTCSPNWPTIRYGYTFNTPMGGLMPNSVVYENYYLVPMVFPIIQVDTTVPPEEYCPPVENLAVHNLGGGAVEVTWDAHPDHRYGYDVQVGFLGQPLSAWTTRYSERNFVQIPDLEVGRMYNIRVRAFCDAEEVDISDWCDVLMFAVEDSTEVGMEPSPLSQHTTVAPNPSTHSMTVSSDFVIMSLDLYDAAGRHLWNQQVGRRSETLDLSSHAAGRYLLMVTTPQGTTPKVLIKQ